MRKKRGKPSFVSKSKNLLFALLVVAAAVTVYGIAQAAVVSHTGSEIVGKVGAAKQSDNSDLHQAYTVPDIITAAKAAGGATGGCVGGICSEITKGYYIGIDWDGDGYSMLTGDCDETCKDCKPGSLTVTTTPDGLDQNCNGVLDDASKATKTKSCNMASFRCLIGAVDEEPEYWSWCTNWVTKSGLFSACSSFCGSATSTLTVPDCPYTGSLPGGDDAFHTTIDFNSCGMGGVPSSITQYTFCRGFVKCDCAAQGYQ